MNESLLKNLLSGLIRPSEFVKWLKNDEITVEINDLFSSFECSQSEFILYFLNYIHEETSSVLQSLSNQATPINIKTPRRIETISERSLTRNTSVKRISLFPDKQTSPNDPFLGVSQLEIESQSPFRLTSTPRQNKSRSSVDRSVPSDADHSLRDCVSPISPAINRNNKNNSESRNKSQSTPKHTRNDASFCLGDFIVQRKSSTKKKHRQHEQKEPVDQLNIENCLNHSNVESVTPIRLMFDDKTTTAASRRRINPTNLSVQSNAKRMTCLNDSNNGFSFQTAFETDDRVQNAKDPRDILREERQKIVQRSKLDNNRIETTRINRTQSISVTAPDLTLVTHKTQLESLVVVYSTLIDLNLVLNTLSELYFLITLVLTQCPNEMSDQNIEELRTTLKNSLTDPGGENHCEGLFKSVHNCVFFAVSVLHLQQGLLRMLDRPSLKLLQDNSRLKMFAPDLAAQLMVYYALKTERKIEIRALNGGENVSFISETDNRDNFPSNTSFHAFRKQRDLFYELLHIWDLHHMQTDWCFAAVLSTRIRTLLSLNSHPVNCMHLARLFKNQLIADCTQVVNGAPLPAGLAPVDAGKLCRLRDRLVSQRSTGGPSPEPSFPARQEFYKDFIVTVQSPSFYRHLSDCFVAEILLLDETVFCATDADDSDAVIDSVVRALYLSCLRSLKLFAKFLGFLDALPYKTECTPNFKLLANQIELRKHFTPTINLIQKLDDSIQTRKLTLSIPWITEYLAQLDHTTLRLPFFSSLIETLFELHYNTGSGSLTTAPAFMLKLSLGWLFERPNFPLDSYQSWISSKYQSSPSRDQLKLMPVKSDENLRLDHLDLVDESVLYICCPYLSEIRNCLRSDPNSNSTPVKYIRPVSTVENVGNGTKKRLELQLEEAFFHGHPSSMRRTVDLVSERVTSVCVKSICNSLVPEAKSKGLSTFRRHLEHITTDCIDAIEEQLANCCSKWAKDYAVQVYEEFCLQTQELIDNLCLERCAISLKALLSDDIHLGTKQTCISITVRQTKQKVTQWFDTHVNLGVFHKEYVTEIENMKHGKAHSAKKLVYHLPPRGRNVAHNPDAKSPVTMIAKLREFLYTALQNADELKLDEVRIVIAEASLTCTHRCDLNAVAQNIICKMLLDFYLLTATRRPDVASDPGLHSDLVTFWERFLEPAHRVSTFERLLCPRNVSMFEQSPQPVQTWTAFAGLIVALLRSQLLEPDVFKQQAIAMFRYDWKPESVKYFTVCLQTVIDQYSNGRDQFTLILNWLADFCNDDAFF